jgi:hypothetical protein
MRGPIALGIVPRAAETVVGIAINAIAIAALEFGSMVAGLLAVAGERNGAGAPADARGMPQANR